MSEYLNGVHVKHTWRTLWELAAGVAFWSAAPLLGWDALRPSGEAAAFPGLSASALSILIQSATLSSDSCAGAAPLSACRMPGEDYRCAQKAWKEMGCAGRTGAGWSCWGREPSDRAAALTRQSASGVSTLTRLATLSLLSSSSSDSCASTHRRRPAGCRREIIGMLRSPRKNNAERKVPM